MTKVTAIAVAMKLIVAIKAAGERAEVPERPWPEAQPPAQSAPYPMRTPAKIEAASGQQGA